MNLHQLSKKNKVSVLIILFSIGFFYGVGKNKEILRVPEHGIVVFYKKTPFFSPRVELRRFNGQLLDSKKVGDLVEAKDVEIHRTENALIILPGDSDWVWQSTLWEKK